MKINKFNSEEEWLESRRGKVTGSTAKDIITKRGNEVKVGVYALIADRIAVQADDEDRMERGKRLEKEAILKLSEDIKTDFIDDLVIWEREDYPNIAISPDAYTKDLKKAAEAKCLNSATHLKALLEEKIPNEYIDQGIQYFVVNDKLETLYFVFYDPRIEYKPYFNITMNRSDYVDVINVRLEAEKEIIDYVEETVNELSGF